MKGITRVACVLAAVLVLSVLAVPAAEACCIPCDPWCKKFLTPSDPCCTGIPEPGNACGLTTCGEFLGGPRPEPIDDEVASSETPEPPLRFEEPVATPVRCQELQAVRAAD